MPVPFSTYKSFGGAFEFGFAPCSVAIVMQILQLLIWATVRGRSFFFTTLNVCGPSEEARLTTVIVPPT